MTGWPISLDRACANARSCASAAAPGVNGQISVIVLSGNFCALAKPLLNVAHRPSSNDVPIFRRFISCLLELVSAPGGLGRTDEAAGVPSHKCGQAHCGGAGQ